MLGLRLGLVLEYRVHIYVPCGKDSPTLPHPSQNSQCHLPHSSIPLPSLHPHDPVSLLAAGVRPTDPTALELARAIANDAPEEVTLVGVYAHCGNTYGCSGADAIQAIARTTTNAVLGFVAA